MTSIERFSYQGPANIGGVDFDDVHLDEERDAGLRSWEGSTSFLAAAAPAEFTPGLANVDTVAVRLPDGREGRALVSNVAFDGQHWTIDLQGTGPAPTHP
jgi:hypothetical protein